MHNWRRYPSSNWYEIDQKTPKNAVLNLALCCGVIWRHREKSKHKRTTTIHPVYNCSIQFLEICFLQDFWCAQSCSFRAVFGLHIRNLTLLSAPDSDVSKIFFNRCTSACSLINYCRGIFFRTRSYLYEVVRVRFSRVRAMLLMGVTYSATCLSTAKYN